MIAAHALHVREHHSLLAASERRALVWLAKRMPAWVQSDHLTALGLFSMLVAGAAYWASAHHRWALPVASFALALNWLGDSLDGTLARVRRMERPRYGYYTDHVLDLLGIALLLGGLALSTHMSPVVALAVLAGFVTVEAQVFLATHVFRVCRLNFGIFGPTEVRVILAFGTLYLLHQRSVHIAGRGPFLLFDVGGIIAAVGFALAFAVSALRDIRTLYREEPLP